MKPEDVTQECWEYFLQHRKVKKAIVTPRVINMIRAEAHQAGWTLEQALDHMVLMGWRGFKADWVERGRSKTSGISLQGAMSSTWSKYDAKL
jgi:hypothetical protein